MKIEHLASQWAEDKSATEIGKMADLIHASLLQAFTDGFSWTPAAITSALQNKYHHFFLMRDQTTDQIVAVAHFQVILDEMEILNIGVIESYQGQGLGKRILQSAIYTFRDQGVIMATLEVRSRNKTARKLYEGLGFKQIASRPNYYPVDLDDAIIYQNRM